MAKFNQFWILISIMALAVAPSISCASAGCPACGGEAEQKVWLQEAKSFMSGEPLIDTSSKIADPNKAESSVKADSTAKTESPPKIEAPETRSKSASAMLVPVSDAGSAQILLDVDQDPTEYIPGAVHIPYTSFEEDSGLLKPAAELVKVLGDAGINESDEVVIYGQCPCQAGASIATYAYWIMKYLGHEKEKVLDGSVDDWVAMKLPTVSRPEVLPETTYVSHLRPELLASYDYVKSGLAQVVDSRTAKEFEVDSIPEAINIPYEDVMQKGKIKDEASLGSLFKDKGLAKQKPIVVYTDTGVTATVVWFALDLLGYDARLYTWNDWESHQPILYLKDVHAEPNPAKTGDIVRITATFSGEAAPEPPESNASGETVLTVMQCTTCGGFAAPQGYAVITQENNTTGAVSIGSAVKSSSGGLFNDSMTCTATITDSSGNLAGKAILKRVANDEFSGIWNANVGGGVYKVTLALTTPSGTKTFRNILEIEVTGSTSKYKNLGT
jgi:thiosulfate/3-mercaptopyruvate sulfurtransferase